MALEDLLHRMRRLLARPALPDAEADRVAASAHAMALALVAISVFQAVVLSQVLEDPRRAIELDLALFACAYAALIAARRGWARLAAALLVAVLYFGATGAVVLAGRIGAALATFYLLAILTAGLLLGGRAVVSVAALCAVTGAFLAFLEQRGALAPWVVDSAWSSFSSQVVSYVFAALLLRDALGRLRAALSRAESSEAQARAVFDQASDGLVISGRDGALLDVNARAAEIAGVSRDEIVRRGLPGFMRAEALEAVRRRYETLTSGERRSRELRFTRDDGSSVVLEATSTALSDGRILSILRDETERRRNEAELEQVRTAMDHLGEGIALFDARYRLLYANSAFQAFFAGDLDVTPGLFGAKLARSPAASKVLGEIAGAVRGARTFRGRFERTNPDGTRVVRHITVAPVHDPGGRIASVAIVQDITHETELEESLQRAQKLDAVGRIAAGLAHDFNNLLTVLFSAVETLAETEQPTEAARQATREIRTTAEIARDHVSQLLSLSRHRLTRREVIDPNAAIEESRSMLSQLLRANVRLTLRLDPGAGAIEADVFQIHQLLLNLAANARDAMPEGGELEISTAATRIADDATSLALPAGEYVVVAVRDAGQGMDDATLRRLFEPFFTTKAEGQGTGLGLVSVKSIVEQSGGAVEVESELGTGTTVRIYWPRAARAAETRERAPRATPASRARILVVDDDDAVRRTLVRSLARSGHDVIAARSGEEGLEVGLAAQGLDLLITDIAMPGIDGPTLAVRLREQSPELAVLFSSGYASEDRIGVLEPGRTEFLAKPFSPAELAARVAEMLVRAA